MKRLAQILITLGFASICLGNAFPDSGYAAGLGQVGCFAGSQSGLQNSCLRVTTGIFGEEVQLGGTTQGAGGLAVNYTGSGGVPAGTVYAALGASPNQIAMYEPSSDGGLKFVQRWEVSASEGPYEICGPTAAELPSGSKPGEHSACPPRVEAVQSNVDVAVDQTTGNVYFQHETNLSPGRDVIIEYTANGDDVITRFGEMAAFGAKTAETPNQIHSVQFPGALAVDNSGNVYLSDSNNQDSFYHRVMRFEPVSPGNVTEYKYAGIGRDIAAGTVGSGPPPSEPAVDSSGHIYVGGEEHTISEYDPTTPSAPPICTFSFKPGAIKAMTVNPQTGAVYFYAANPPVRVHELSPCDPLTGKFSEVSQIEFSPERADFWAMTFDPVKQFSPDRPAGELFAAAPSGSSDPGAGKGEPGQSSLGYIFAPSPESPPTIETASVSGVGQTSASLQGTVNANGFHTDYSFQYLTAAAFSEAGESFAGAGQTPAGGASAGEGQSPVAVAAVAADLTPSTEYVYRLVVESNCSPAEPERICEAHSPSLTFRTSPFSLASLADHRAYEMVSPAQKQGGQVFPLNPRVATCTNECKPGLGIGRFPMQTTPDGSSVAFEGSAFAGGIGNANENAYVGNRSAAGWSDVIPTPGLLRSRAGEGYKAFSQDLRSAVLEQRPPALSAEAPSEYKNLYFQTMETPSVFKPALTSAPPHRPPSGSPGVVFEIEYAGAAADLSRVFFRANDALPTSISPDVPPPAEGPGTQFNLYEWQPATGTLQIVNVKPGNAQAEADASFGPGSANAISADGRRVYWSNASGQVFLREDAETTTELPDTGKFLAASSDGSRVLLNNGHLYNVASGTIEDLTEGSGGFVGAAGYGADLGQVYFVDTKVLTEELNGHSDKAQSGQLNLYAWNEAGTRFIGTLLPSDDAEGASETIGLSRDWAAIPTVRTAGASPTGRYLAFMSKASLTGFNNEGPPRAHCAVKSGAFASGPCAEVFLYDSAANQLICASCNSSGATPLGWSQVPVAEGPRSLPQARFLTDSGRLYFDSGDSLSQFDVNAGAQDVYEWEPQGIGTCGTVGGCVALISSGTEGRDSNFTTVDPSGANVFFTTRNQLVPQDQDELIDLYDAREFGGFSGDEVIAPAECQGEGCQSAPGVSGEAPPASSSVSGSGNVKQQSCKKGQVKKKGKCVKKAKKHKQHKKSGKGSKHGGAR